jgi:hypothetical protein
MTRKSKHGKTSKLFTGRAGAFAATGLAAVALIIPGAAEAKRKVPSGNLTVNPSFTTSVDGWSGFQSDVSRVRDRRAPAGRHVAKVMVAPGAQTYTIDDAAATVTDGAEAGSTYKARAFVRGTSRNAGNMVGIVIRETEPDGSVVNETENSVKLSRKRFKRVVVTTTAEETGNSFDVYLRRASGDVVENDAFRADAISVTEIIDEILPDDPPEDPPPPPPPPPSGDCGWGSFSAANQPDACWRPYSSRSPFNGTLPSAPRQLGNSSAIASRVANFGHGGPKFDVGLSGTGSDYNHPIYYSQPSDPQFTIHCTENRGAPCPLEGQQIRIPNQAKPAGGSDAHLAVIDQGNNWEYDLYGTGNKPNGGGQLNVLWSGKTRIGTSDAHGLGSNATAAYFGLAAGVVRPAELAAGEINHALFMAVKCTNGSVVAPAQGGGRVCSSMGLSNQNAPAMGAHFFLNMTQSEINTSGASSWQKTIMRAMAEYGMFVGDTGADYNGWGIQLESGSSFTSFGQADPWVKLAKDLGVPSWTSGGRRLYHFDMSNAVNWGNKLRVADPCVSSGTC